MGFKFLGITFGTSNKKDKIKYLNEKREYELRNKVFDSIKNLKIELKTLNKIQKEDPNSRILQDVKNPEEYKWRGWALNASMNGEYEKAVEYCNKGIKINPESAYLFYLRGRSKGDIQQFNHGIEDLNAAIKIKPNFADAFVERGYIKQKKGDIKGAEEDYKKAKEIEPSIVLPE